MVEQETNLAKQNKFQELMRINSDESIRILGTIKLPSDVSLQEVRRIETPPISALVKNGNKSECFKLISSMLVILNQYFGVSWSEFQIREATKEFYSNYFFWHQLDLKNFFRLCKQMTLAPKLLSVNQFSPPILFEWANEYNSEWVRVSEEISHLKTDATNYDPKRETEFYNIDVAQRLSSRNSEDRIQSMQDIINYQRKIIEDQR